MAERRVYDDEKHIHFVTFSCYRRRRLLDSDRAKRIVIGHLGSKLAQRNGLCLGFVIMPDHVHAMVWFLETRQLSPFMNEWKGQSSHALKKLLRTDFPNYTSQFDESDAIWQARYYGFNIWSRKKVEEKLDYMHMNPVRGIGRVPPNSAGRTLRHIRSTTGQHRMSDPARIDPSKLTPRQTAELLTRLGKSPVELAAVERDLNEGVPLNPDGSLNMLSYGAWLVRELACVSG